jgi:uncharacterized LabA/DUF88 family protein
MTNNDLRLAVLIDADNVPYSGVKEMFEEMAKYGTPTFKRIYADWTKPTVSGWKACVTRKCHYAYSAIQLYDLAKNATDSAMIIDAMDILYSGKVDGFCIVSSDSDFTRLATRLREAGMKVFGFGEKKTPKPFISACDKFIYVEILTNEPETEETETGKPAAAKPLQQQAKPAQKQPILRTDKKLIKLITDSIEDIADETGWAFLGDLGNMLIKKMPNFDSRNYGFSKLVQLIRSIDVFEIDQRETGKGNIKHVFVKRK